MSQNESMSQKESKEIKRSQVESKRVKRKQKEAKGGKRRQKESKMRLFKLISNIVALLHLKNRSLE